MLLKKIALIVMLSLISCTQNRVDGFAVFSIEGEIMSTYECKLASIAVEIGDLAALAWARNFPKEMGSYETVAAALKGTQVCFVPRPDLCKTSWDTNIKALGCSGYDWIWFSATDQGHKIDYDWVMIHEMAHVVAKHLDLPTSNAHTELIHTHIEPMVYKAYEKLRIASKKEGEE